MNEEVISFLHSLGLSKTEVLVYLDLLKNSTSTANEIAKRTSLHRSNVYDLLDRLKRRGIVAQILKDNVTLFQAQDPEKFREYIKQLERRMDELIPSFKSLPRQQQQKEEVSVLHGIMAVRNSLDEIVAMNSPIYVLGVPEMAVEKLGLKFLDEFHKKRIEKGIPIKIVYTGNMRDRMEKIKKLPFTHASYFPKYMDSPVTLLITESEVHIVVFKDPLIVVKIRNKDIAEFYIQNFLEFWHHLEWT